jgi:hypothetical protein
MPTTRSKKRYQRRALPRISIGANGEVDVPEKSLSYYKTEMIERDELFCRAMRRAINEASEGEGGADSVLTPAQEAADLKDCEVKMAYEQRVRP